MQLKTGMERLGMLHASQGGHLEQRTTCLVPLAEQ